MAFNRSSHRQNVAIILSSMQQFPLLASQPLLLISRGQFDHPFWVNARQMVIKIGAMSVSNQAHVRRWADPTGDEGESPDLPTDTSGEPVGFTRYWSSRWGETSLNHTRALPTPR